MIWCFTKKLCTRCDTRAGSLLWWSCQSPVAHSCGLLNHLNTSTEECSNWMQNLMQIHCPSWSVILNVTATQYTCSLSGIYHPHWLVQWRHHCSHAHYSPLSLVARSHWCCVNDSCCINNGWTFSRQTLYTIRDSELINGMFPSYLLCFLVSCSFKGNKEVKEVLN